MEFYDVGVCSPAVREHALNPRNYGPMEKPIGHARITGPCGDTMEFWVDAQGGILKRVAFVTDGCGPSVASGSAAVALAEGKRVEVAATLSQSDILDALGGLPVEFEHCALLAAITLKAACDDCPDGEGGTRPERHEDNRGAPDAPRESRGDQECPAPERPNGESAEEFADGRVLQSRMGRIKRKIIVLSGKGGVGKSTVAVNIAVALMLSGKRVGLLDIDIHGPSIPIMLGLEGARLRSNQDALLPIDMNGLKVMSLGFLLRSQDDAVIWRGPMKMNVIRQFLKDVEWGDLDFLIVDSPPGTGDEPLSVCQLLGTVDGAILVTTPQKVAAVDVRKSISFCRQLGVPVLGVVENMSGFACPRCGEVTQIFPAGAGKRISRDMHVPFLGSIPMDPKIAESGDSGRAYILRYSGSPTAAIMREIVKPIEALERETSTEGSKETGVNKEKPHMRIAIPVSEGKLSTHFGHCDRFALIDVNPATKEILKREEIDAPPHEPGLLPSWLAERGTTTIIAGGMGQRAQALFAEQGINVVIGAPSETPEHLVAEYLAGRLQTGENVCDH
jgi:ATP-binding protein involved in chromosome partitioning